MATKYQLTTEGDDVARLAAGLANPNAFRGAADDLLRSIGIGPPELARLTLAPRAERRRPWRPCSRSVAARAETKANEPPAETTAPAVASTMAPKADNLPVWRLEHLRRHGSA